MHVSKSSAPLFFPSSPGQYDFPEFRIGISSNGSPDGNEASRRAKHGMGWGMNIIIPLAYFFPPLLCFSFFFFCPAFENPVIKARSKEEAMHCHFARALHPLPRWGNSSDGGTDESRCWTEGGSSAVSDLLGVERCWCRCRESRQIGKRGTRRGQK